MSFPFFLVNAEEVESKMKFQSIYAKNKNSQTYYKDMIFSSLPYLKTKLNENTNANRKTVVVPDLSFPVQIEVNDRLHLEFLMDKGDVYQYVVNEFLVKSGASEEELLKNSINNIWAKIESGMQVFPVGNLKGLVIGGDVDASLFIIDQIWDKSFSDPSKGDIIVAIPARDMITFGYSNIDSTVQELEAIVDRTWENGDHLITKQLYIRKNSKWVEFVKD